MKTKIVLLLALFFAQTFAFGQVQGDSLVILNQNLLNDLYKKEAFTRKGKPAAKYDFPSIFLKSNYVEIGLHPAGSFGSDLWTPIPEEYHPTWTYWSFSDTLLGFTCDIQGDGYENGTPPFMGDYFVPGAPLEGWGVEWDNDTTSRNFLNYGAIGDYAPAYFAIQPTRFEDKSTENEKKALWEGEVVRGNEALFVRQIVRLGIGDYHFTIEVMMQNTGADTLKSVEYFRNVDPDIEFPHTPGWNYETRNYVKAQPGTPNNADTAVVVAHGLVYNSPLILGTVDSRAKVSTEGDMQVPGQVITDPDRILDSPQAPSAADSLIGDYQIALAYRFGNLAPGECVNFVYYYNMEDIVAPNFVYPLENNFDTTRLANADSVLFTENASGVGAVAIIEHWWDFDGDGEFELTGDSAYHNFRCPGTYQVSLKVRLCDGTLDVITKTLEIDFPPAIQIDSTRIQPVLCYGENSGSFEIFASGGADSLQFALNSGEMQTGNRFEGLGFGKYELLVQDAHGCRDSLQFEMPQPRQLALNGTKTDIELCYGDSTGNIALSPQGGTPAYRFALNDTVFSLQSQFENLPAGKYTAFVQDQNGCTDSLIFSLNQPPALLIDTVFVSNVNCFGYENGSLTAFASGGTPPYFYAVNESNFDTIFQFENLSAGFYELKIEDQNQCQLSENVEIDEPSALYIDIETHNSSYYNSDNGSISYNVGGGTPEYSVRWTNSSGLVVNALDNLPFGEYFVSVTDSRGCTLNDSVAIGISDMDSEILVPNVFTPNNDGLNDRFRTKHKNIERFFCVIHNRWGRKIYQFDNPETGWNGKIEKTNNDAAEGVYFYVIRATGYDGKQFDLQGAFHLLR